MQSPLGTLRDRNTEPWPSGSSQSPEEMIVHPTMKHHVDRDKIQSLHVVRVFGMTVGGATPIKFVAPTANSERRLHRLPVQGAVSLIQCHFFLLLS